MLNVEDAAENTFLRAFLPKLKGILFSFEYSGSCFVKYGVKKYQKQTITVHDKRRLILVNFVIAFEDTYNSMIYLNSEKQRLTKTTTTTTTTITTTTFLDNKT